MGIMVRMLVFLVLSVLSGVVMIGVAVAACFTFFPSPSNAAVESVSALAREYLPSDIWYSSAAATASGVLARVAQSPSAWLTGLISKSRHRDCAVHSQNEPVPANRDQTAKILLNRR